MSVLTYSSGYSNYGFMLRHIKKHRMSEVMAATVWYSREHPANLSRVNRLAKEELILTAKDKI